MRRLLSCVVRWRGGDFVTFAGLSFVVGVTDVMALWLHLDDVVVRHEQAQTYVIQEVADADAATFDTQTPAFLRSFVSSQSVVFGDE